MIVSHAAGPGRGGWEEQLAGPDDANFSECFSLAEPGQTRSGFGYGSLAFPFAEWSRAFRNPTAWGSDFSHRCEGPGLVTGVVSWVEPSRVGTGPVPVFCVVFPFPPHHCHRQAREKRGEKGKDNTKGKHFLERERSKREKPTTRPRRRGLCRRLMRQTDVGRGAIRTARANNGPTSTLVSPAVVSGAKDITTQDTRRK